LRGLDCFLRLLSDFLGLLPFTNVADEAGKYAVSILDQFSERNLHGKLLAILSQADQFGALPVDMPLASSQVPLEATLVQLPQEFWHEHGQRFPNQLRRVIAKDSRRGGISKQNCTGLVQADHRITGRFDHKAVFFFGVAARRFLLFTLGNILDDSKPKWCCTTDSRNESDIVTPPN
jgi:hypothetical protein